MTTHFEVQDGRECLVCTGRSTRRYHVQWDDGNVIHSGEYCICDAQHCYNVLYSLIDDHHKNKLNGNGSFTLQLIGRTTVNDDPFA